MGMGDGGLGIGDWAQSPIPNPQSPIPNPHVSHIILKEFIFTKLKIFSNKKVIFKYINQCKIL